MNRIGIAPAFVLCAVSFGQSAELSGLIRDPARLGVAGVEITLRNEHTGGRRVTRSNASGFYSLPTLNPGEYRLSVRAAGFETIVREDIRLEVGENARIDFDLRLGESRTEITVSGKPALMNTENGSVGTVVDRDIIDQMPLNGRGIQALIELSPGVVVIPVVDASRGQFAVNGQRSDANYFTVDGVSANFAVAYGMTASGLGGSALGVQAGSGMIPANNFFGTFSNLVSPEALQEFKIQTSSFPPEYGRSPGAQVELLTRSGTNRYSGSLFEYLRNDRADANDWFANRDALSKPPLRFNNFGGTLGGPVRVPRLYNGRDRTFFFLSIEDAVSVQPQPPVNVVVPSMEARRNAPPAVTAVLNAYPLPNRPYGSDGDADITGLARYVGAYSLRQSQQTYSLRLDHAFFDRLMSFARYSRAPSRRLDSGNAPTIANFELATETLTAGFTHTATPHLINAIRLNGSRQTALSEFDIHGAAGAQRPPEQVFFPPGYSYKDSEILFGVSPSPLMGFGTNVRNDSRQWQIVDNLSYAAGAHRFRTGVDYRWFAPITILPRFIYLFTFPSIYGPTGVYSGTIPQAGAFFDNIPETAFVVEHFLRMPRTPGGRAKG